MPTGGSRVGRGRDADPTGAFEIPITRGKWVAVATSPSPQEVLELLHRGVDRRSIVGRLVETGVWSEAGAENIIVLLSRGVAPPVMDRESHRPNGHLKAAMVARPLGSA